MSCSRLLGLVSLALCAAAHAGAPFLTDDPEPVDLHHTEINLAVQGTRATPGTSGTVAADVNHGCAKDVQCHLAVPLAFSKAAGQAMATGLGDVELGVKYRFINHGDGGFMAAVYPTVFMPTGNASRGLGNGRAQVLLPLWLQDSAGAWTWDAGFGYLVNRAAGARNSWYLGLLVLRPVGDHLKVGAEIFHRTPVAEGAPATTGFDLGAIVKLTDTRNLLLSMGRGLQGVSSNHASVYVAYQLEL